MKFYQPFMAIPSQFAIFWKMGGDEFAGVK